MAYKISKDTIAEFRAKYTKELKACDDMAYDWYDKRFDGLTYDCDRECYDVSTSVYDRDRIVSMIKDRYRTLKNQTNNAYDQYVAEIKEQRENLDFFMSVLDFTTFDQSNIGTTTYIDFENLTVDHRKDSKSIPGQYTFVVSDKVIPRWNRTCYFSLVKIKLETTY